MTHNPPSQAISRTSSRSVGSGFTNLMLVVIAGLMVWMQLAPATAAPNHVSDVTSDTPRVDDTRDLMTKAVFALEAISEDIDLMYRNTERLRNALQPMAMELRLIQENTEAIFNNTAEFLDLE